jgi:iron(III) transport system substrate-binding protein
MFLKPHPGVDQLRTSFPRKRETRFFPNVWMPACAGMTMWLWNLVISVIKFSVVGCLLSLLVPLFVFLSAYTTFAASAENWKAEWEQTLAAAKKEGEISFYGSQGYDKVFEVFQKRYPEIKVKSITNRRGSEHGQAVMTERRAGQYLVDLFINGVVTPNQVFLKANILEPIRPALILPEVLDESKWWNGKHHYADPEGRYVFVFQGNVHGGENAYNTKLVNPKEIKSYWDFVHPRWKGKIVAYDVSRVSTVAHSLRFLYNHPDLGAPFIKRFFGEMDITYSRDERQMIDWLGAGKFHIAFFVTDIEDAAKQGLPVRFFEPNSFKEGAFVGPSQGGVTLFKNAPHPNAAKVALNWLLSQEGQIAYQTAYAQLHDVRQSMREDIPMDVIPPAYRRQKGVNYIYSGRPEWLDMGEVAKLIKDVQAVKR